MWDRKCSRLPSQAPPLLWPAPRGAFQTAQVCVRRGTADPAPGDPTATLSAPLGLMDPVAEGADFFYSLQPHVVVSVDHELAGSVLRGVLFSCCRYYCVGGAVTPTPSDGITGGPCPEGSSCPEGTVQPVPCPPGAFAAVTRATRCEACLAGWFCLAGSLYLCPAGLGFFQMHLKAL